jgi:cytochrome c oxidase subunit 2
MYLLLLLPLVGLKEITCDASQNWQLSFQDPATPVMEGVINFHNDLMIVVVGVGVFVGYVMFSTVRNFEKTVNPTPNRVQHGTRLEIIWTITPALILMCVAVPSFALLYSVDEIIDPEMTIKAVGHQWYWSYEYSDL